MICSCKMSNSQQRRRWESEAMLLFYMWINSSLENVNANSFARIFTALCGGGGCMRGRKGKRKRSGSEAETTACNIPRLGLYSVELFQSSHTKPHRIHVYHLATWAPSFIIYDVTLTPAKYMLTKNAFKSWLLSCSVRRKCRAREIVLVEQKKKNSMLPVSIIIQESSHFTSHLTLSLVVCSRHWTTVDSVTSLEGSLSVEVWIALWMRLHLDRFSMTILTLSLSPSQQISFHIHLFV